MNRSVITFLIYLFAVISVNADTKNIEKFENTADNNADTLRFSEFMALSKNHFPDNLPLAHKYTESAMYVAQKNNNQTQMGLAEERFGFLYKSAGDFEQAELHYNAAADIFHDNQDYSKSAWIKKMLADIEMETGNYVESMNLYIEASKLAEEANDKKALAFCYRGISFLYYQYHEPLKSLENSQKAYHLLLETDYDTLDLADMLQTLAVALGSNGQLDSAIACYELSAQYNKMYNNIKSVAGNLNNIALIYENRGMYNEALTYYLQCLRIDTQAGDNLGLTFSHIGSANVYFKMNQLDSALYHAQKSFQIANSIGALHRIQKAGESLIKIYKELGQYDSSLHYFEITSIVKDSIYQRAKIRESYELQTKYETEKKEKEIQLLTEQKESAEFRRNTYIFIGIAVSFFLLLLYNQQRLRNRKNKQLLEKEKDMDRLKSRFFANISHEFRTPLTLILSPLDDMISKIEYPDIKKRLKVIKRNAGRLLDLVNQLLDLSKIESGKLMLNMSRSDIISLIKGVCMSFHSIAEQKNIELKMDVFPEHLEMNYDREKMETILINLLSNAFKFTPDNGKIRVQSDIHGVKKSSGVREFLKIMVSDSGNGVPAKETDQIFNRFYQSENNQLLQQEGSGIGLALTKELVELHEGSIYAESSPGKGMQIIFQIPIDLESLKSSDSGKVIYPKGKLLITREDHSNELDELKDLDTQLPQILLIEDHKDVRKYIQEILEDNYNIFLANDGEMGIESAMELIPDLILSDVMMPKKNGYEVCRILKNDEKTSHIPIILLTAMSDTEDKIEGLHTQADDYITKPFIPRELQARIKNLIESRNQLKEKYKKKGVLKPKEIAVNSIDEKFLNRLIEIIEHHIGNEKFGVEQLGEELGMSRSQLHRKLKALLDTGPNQFIRQFRLQRAYDLLKQNAATASEISYQVGFGSPSYFTKCFHEHFGYPPSEVLGQLSENPQP